MANTVPPIDTPERVKEATFRAVAASVQVLTGCALTKGLQGEELVEMEACAAAGAAAFSDDGRNAFSPRLLSEAIARAPRRSAAPVLIHPEDEEIIAQVNNVQGPVQRCPLRPVEAETRAVDFALRALAHAGKGHVHLQHVSAAASVEMIRRAKEAGANVTAEATPHHLGMWLPFATEPQLPGLLKVNPPLRTDQDREALVQALRDGVIDAVATDHAPHRVEEKALPYDRAAPGMIGLELALAICITLGGMGGDWIPTLVERLTIGPYRVLGQASGVRGAAAAHRRGGDLRPLRSRGRVDRRARPPPLRIAEHAAARRAAARAGADDPGGRRPGPPRPAAPALAGSAAGHRDPRA